MEQLIERRLSARRNISPEEAQERVRVEAGAAKLRNRPISKWPDFTVQWDLRITSQHLAFDGYDSVSFFEEYPFGLKLLEVELSTLDSRLTNMFRQSPDEFWRVGVPNKKARIIFEWFEGKSLTPALVVLHESGGQLCLTGNHRLAVARAKGEVRVPVLTIPEEAERIKTLLEASEIVVSS